MIATIMTDFGLATVFIGRCIAYADRYSSMYVGAIGACLAALAALVE